MSAEVLAEEDRNFVVFKHGNDWVLTYLAGNVGLYDVSMRLSNEQVAQIRVKPDFAKSSAEYFRLKSEHRGERQLCPAVWPSRE